ncbi:hypothetical protein OPT61_g952 [Boeremia exigua]|uniref:Uncharacterized protein n=1 Tax=Boeremia exigua TaxID=749465 RepID=A0ACC2IS34_9PLEO|nr:hypothetical protein OPT61_g952 [Boeremia exigua]
MTFVIHKKHWAAEVKRIKRTTQNVVAEATVGVAWGEVGARKALELRLDVLCRWPFVCASFKKGPLPLPIEEQEDRWAAYISRVEREEVELEEHLVASGESCSSARDATMHSHVAQSWF